MDIFTITQELDELYKSRVAQPWSINELLPILASFARGNPRIVELGTEVGFSTVAWMYGGVRELHCYDWIRHTEIDRIERVAAENGIRFTFTTANTIDRAVTIPACDVLFIDTYHHYDQLKAELALHAWRAEHYIILHDTESYGESGDVAGKKGLWPAIIEWLYENRDHWRIKEHYSHNNGLTVLSRYQ